MRISVDLPLPFGPMMPVVPHCSQLEVEGIRASSAAAHAATARLPTTSARALLTF